MEGSVLDFLKAEWKVSDTGWAHWASSFTNDKCTKKVGFKNIFNEEYELYQPKETYEIYIFKTQIVKMIIVLVYFKDRSSRMPIYVWDELYFFKGSFSIRITQWSR